MPISLKPLAMLLAQDNPVENFELFDMRVFNVSDRIHYTPHCALLTGTVRINTCVNTASSIADRVSQRTEESDGDRQSD
ncbi:MAG: hypothetical protein HC866_25960 [Leptolyngbyaceae cyanobacterium RU_5_1]|nr:hypothetical protein [Leptolyngbyaceae cyanobacterium RU_5_1]